MRRRRLERLFARYRKRGDLGALAAVFDHTAVDLLRLAQHLSRDGADAEDLVQETFVTAIERAASWEPERPLLPWLAGILAHKAAALRRRKERELSPSDVRIEARETPHEALVARELAHELTRALASLEPAERALLVPYLRGERAPRELASELGIAPGTVRMRIHRGLERLRRLLPAGVGAGVLGVAVSGRGLAAVRRAVLAHAAHAGGVPTVTSLTTGGAAALTLAMTKTTVLLGSIAGAIVIAGALFFSHGEILRPASSPHSRSHANAASPSLDDGPANDAGDARIAAASSPSSSLDEKASERVEATRKSLRIVGRVLGVEPGHMDGVRLTVVPAAHDPSGTNALYAMGGLVCTKERGGTTCTTCHQPPERVETDFGDLYMELSAPEQREYETQSACELTELRVDDEGRFSVELADLFADDDSMLPHFFEVFAEHELYFAAMLVVELTATDRELFLADTPVVLGAELELAPAAIVRGTLQGDDSAARVWQTAVAEELHGGEIVWATADEDYESQPQTLAITLEISGSLELSEGTLVLRSLPTLGSFFFDPGATIALFRIENGVPLATPAAQTNVQPGSPFELKLAEEGDFVLLACKDGKRPRTIATRLRLRSVTNVDPFALDPGASVQGTLVTEPGTGECSVVASRKPSSDDFQIELAPHALVWSNDAFEWRSVTSAIDEQSHFQIDGLAPEFYTLSTACSVELDLARSAAQARGEGLTSCLAPSSGIVLAPDYAILAVQLTSGGAALESLPAVEGLVPENDSSEELTAPPAIQMRVNLEGVDRAGEYVFADRTRALVLVDPSTRIRLELVVGEVVRDVVELLAPPAGSRQSVSLDVGEL